MSDHADPPRAQDDVTASKKPASQNPIAQSASIMVSVPESMEIRLVDATALSDYEVWTFLSSILSSAVVGFVVAYCQSTVESEKHIYGAVTTVFGLLMAVGLFTAISKRRKLTGKARRIRFAVGDPLPEDRIG